MQKNLSLRDILYKIKIDGDNEYIIELLKCPQIRGLINEVLSDFSYNKTEIKKIIESVVQDITIFKYQYYDTYTEQQYLSYLRKYIMYRVRERIFKDHKLSEVHIDDQAIYISQIDVTSIDERIDLHNALQLLNQRDQDVINLYYFDGYTQKEIATKCNVSQQAICKRIQVIQKKIKKYMENGC